MTVKERLNDYQKRFETKGAVDIKFCFGALDTKPLSLLGTEVAEALEMALDDKVQKLY
jgi:hypothetical protein